MKTFARFAGLFVLAASTLAAAQTASLDTITQAGAILARDKGTGLVSFVGSPSGSAILVPALPPGDPATSARSYLQSFAPHFGIADVNRDMQVTKVRKSPVGTTTRFQQTSNGVPVFAGDLVVNMDNAGRLRAIAGKASDRTVDATPTVSAADAAQAAMTSTARKYKLSANQVRASVPTLAAFDPRLVGMLNRGGGLVWRVTVTSSWKSRVKELVLVNATSGAVVLAYNQIHTERDRATYDTNSTSILPGTFECGEATVDCTSGAIPDADKAHAYAADVYDFYFSRFGRDGIDNAGGQLISTTRYCDPTECPLVNAFFDGTQMVYGAGMVADDVAAHEFTHGITAAESALIYFGEPGAINESISDVFGEFVDQVNGQGNDSPDVKWLMGEDTYIGAIRSMSNPPAYGQPDKKSSPNWYTGGDDEAGVHTNSGVGNKAAFLMTDGGAFNGHTVTGIGLEKVAQIWYEAQTMLLGSGSNYNDLYNALNQACASLTGTQGISAADCTQVMQAGQAVEMNASSQATSAKPYCAAGTDPLVIGADDFDSPPSGTLTRVSTGPYWVLDSSLQISGTYSMLAVDRSVVTDTSLMYQINTPIVAGDHIYFEHTWDTDYQYDGVVVEYSINGGSTWTDAGSLLATGTPYDATLLADPAGIPSNPIAGRKAFTGFLPQWTYSAYDLSSLAGHTVRWRFRSTADGTIANYGFNLDDVYHYRCSAGDIQVTSDAQTVNEGMGNAIVTVSRGAGASGAATVHYATSNGTAMAGTDYTTTSGTLTWAAGDARPKNISIPIMNRAGTQADRKFTVTLSAATGGSLGSPAAQVITITNNDGTIQFESPTVTVNENGPNVTINVTRSGFAGPAASVTYTTVAQTATAGSDFTTRTGTLTWPAGDSTPRTITIGPVSASGAYVPIINDTLVEGPETFAINLSAPAGASLGAIASATVTILSDENGLSMATATQSVLESAGSTNIVVMRAGLAGAVDVSYSFVNGTAINGTHYSASNGTLHWDDGDNTPRTVPVTIIDDAVVNANRTFTMSLSGASGATIVTPTSTVVTITDDDNTVQFTAATTSVAESTANLSVTVSRMGSAGAPASVHWSTVDGSAYAGTDYSARSGTLAWAAGSTTSQTITIPILQNTILNGARTFTVQLDTPTGTLLGTNPVVTVTINDDERGVVFAAPSYVVTEGGTATLKVHRVGPATAALSATWSTVNGSAVSGTDFGMAGSAAARTGTVSWTAGDSADKTFTIATIQNTIGGQPDRVFTVNLAGASGVLVGSPGSATVTIQDDDIPPESAVSFDVAKSVVLENAGTAVLVVHRVDVGGGFNRDVTVNYSTVAGSALAASDFVAVTGGTLHWAAGDSSDKTISITIVNNTTAEPAETFDVVLASPTPGLGLGSISRRRVVILDDDELFPAFGAIPAGFTQSAGATKSWHVSNDPGAYEGVYALKSDEIDDGETASLDMTGTFAAGTVSFRVKVSTEPDFDELRFYMDDALLQRWSGVATTGWQAASFPVTAGLHKLTWAYVKDGSVSVGMDAVYLDGLTTPAFTPSP